MQPDILRQIHLQMKAAASVARLPLRSGHWSGVAGSVLGQGTGSSIDFQDQRPYLPGDDPRHINWQAYARSGQYTMKLYRQEVTPRVDVIFDASESMFLNEAKARRTWELVYFSLESALRLGASVKLQTLREGVEEMPLERALAYDWKLKDVTIRPDVPELLERTLLRAGSLRVFISDLLSEAPPERMVSALTHGKGRVIMLVPFCHDEAKPEWDGNIEFDDCERDFRDKRRVDQDILSRYLHAYQTHFALWREQCVRRGIGMARIASEADFLNALRAEAASAGVVELT